MPRPRPLSPFVVLGVLASGLVLLGLTVVLEGVVVAAVRGLSSNEALDLVTHDPGGLALAQLVGLGVPVLLAAYLSEGGPRGFVSRAFAPCPLDRVLAAFVAGLALQLVMVELSHLVTDALPALRHSPDQEAALRETLRIHDVYSAITVPLALVVSAPLTEELLFRAFAQRELALRTTRGASIGVVAVLFALFHMDGASVPSILLAGLALGAIADRWRSVRISIALHAGVNLVPIAITEEILPIRGFNDTDPSSHLAPLVLVTSLAVSVIAFVLAWQGPAPRGDSG
ncbi:MAG: CPBP family intramembrane metalloprotease [Deltaproteobacteria bacterium]|nr:CPBP family intramembrane metalloprotease [Deltaproteobacteria bacterium]